MATKDVMAAAAQMPDIGEKPFHPAPNYRFPSKQISGKSRSAQAKWFADHQWLHYHLDKLYCFYCIKACQQNLISNKNKDDCFISRGFDSWNKAVERLRKHEGCDSHKEAIERISKIPSSVKNIEEMFSSDMVKQKAENRRCLKIIVNALIYLARQNIALRNTDANDSNFVQLLKFSAINDPILQKWIEKKKEKYTHSDIQNELLKIMALQIMRKIVQKIHSTEFFCLMCDETTDVSNFEQAVVMFRHVDDDLKPHEEFMGFYKLDSISAEHIFNILQDTLTRFGLTFTKCRGQSYDGAPNMSGPKSGVAKRITDKEPRALFIHCGNHCLSLAVSDTIKGTGKDQPGSKVLTNALDVAHEIIKLVKNSPRRDFLFHQLKDGIEDHTTNIVNLCPTR